MLFSILKRMKVGRSDKIEEYSTYRMDEMIENQDLVKKSKQNCRKMILLKFFSYRLKQIQRENKKNPNTKESCYKTQFIEYYFKDYITRRNNVTVQALIFEVFGYNTVKKNLSTKKKKNGIWNIHYLKGIVTKSPLLKADLHHYARNLFIKSVVKEYKERIEKFMKILFKKFNKDLDGFQNEKFLIIQKKVQTSRTFMYPWDIRTCLKAKDYFLYVLEEGIYLSLRKGVFMVKERNTN